MSKLLKLKPWLTLSEAASHASNIISEKVKTSDLLQFALEGHITISVNLVNHATASLGRSVHPSEVTYKDVIVPAIISDSESTMRIFDGKFISEEEAIVFEKHVKSISGIWDLSMHGCERLDVEFKYLQLTGGPELTIIDTDGDVLLYRPTDQVWANLKEHFADNPYSKKSDYPLDKDYRKYENFYPAGGLPEDCVWGITPPNLMTFIQSLSEPTSKPKSPSQKTINAYLATINALSAALIDGGTGKHSKDAEAILMCLSLKGIKEPVTAKTLAKYLSESSN